MSERLDRDLVLITGAGGKITVPVLAFYGAISRFADVIDAMADELAERFSTTMISRSGHWMAEENPDEFAGVITDFARRR